MENNDTNLKLANVIFDLAKNAEESGKYEDAIKSYKEVLNVFEQALGAEDEQTKEVYTNIGMCYKALGKKRRSLNLPNQSPIKRKHCISSPKARNSNRKARNKRRRVGRSI